MDVLDICGEVTFQMVDLAKKVPEKPKAISIHTPVSRPDETAAAKNLNIAYL